MRAALGRLSAAVARRPLTVAVGLSTFKAGAADAFTQTVIERRETLDRDRLSVFVAFGCLYQGCFQYLLWNGIFERIWPGASVRASLSKLVATNLISDPVFFFPSFYVIREALSTEADKRQVVQTALQKYRKNCTEDWTAAWSVWIPGHYVTYFCLPVHLRVPWVATASFAYICLLSWMRGDDRRRVAVPTQHAEDADFEWSLMKSFAE
mmetsp:Transcript_122331/g.351467  ORF Transcript_122331/g.351467 Transcript_122331/m.351467 type:complete len:209 (-) Transcript_122331:210-836(-)